MPGISAVKTMIPFSKKGISWQAYWTTQSLLFCGVSTLTPTKVDLTFKWPLLSNAIDVSAFSITGKTISSVVVRESNVTIIVAEPFVYGDALNIVYTKPVANPLTTVNGYEIASFTKAITNGIFGGTELVTGGDFADAGDWTQLVGYARITVSGGLANYVASGYGGLSQALTVTSGKKYLLKYTISGGGAAPLVYFGDTTSARVFTEYADYAVRPNGSYIEYVNCMANATDIAIWGKVTGGNWSMDNLSIQEVTAYVATTWIVKRTGDTDDDAFFAIKRLSNNSYLSGSGYTTGHLYKSTDGGETWVNKGIISAGATDIYDFVDLGNGVVLATTAQDGKMWRSTDYGETWTDLGNVESMKYVTLLVNMGNGIIVGATEKSPYPPNKAVIVRSDDYGLTWSTVFTPIDGVTLMNMAQDCGNGIIIIGMGGYADPPGFTMNAHIARSTDYGATWTDIGEVINVQKRFFSSCNLGNGIILIGADAAVQIYRSTDYGATWARVNAVIAGQRWAMGLLNIGYGRVIATTTPIIPATGGILLKSDDYGITWVQEGVMRAGQWFQGGGIVHDENTVILGSANDGTIEAEIIKNSNGLFVRS